MPTTLPAPQPPPKSTARARRLEGQETLASQALWLVERTTGFEPATPTLARWCSTTEPRPHGPADRRHAHRAAALLGWQTP